MKTEWMEEYLSKQPEEFEKLNSTTYVQRRNIQKLEPDESNQSDRYLCECRFVSEDVKNQIELIREITDSMNIGGSSETGTDELSEEILDKAAAFEYLRGY